MATLAYIFLIVALMECSNARIKETQEIMNVGDNDVETMDAADFSGDAKAAANVYDLVGEETASDDDVEKRSLPFNRYSKIAIIGGGAGGLHMASELKKAGYNNVIVFEKENEVGGKSFGVTVDGKLYPTGTAASPATPAVVSLLKEVGLYKETHTFCSFGQPCFLLYSKNRTQLLTDTKFLEEATKIKNATELYRILNDQLIKFAAIYGKMVDEFGFPKQEYMREMSKPINGFLKKNHLDALIPLVGLHLKPTGYERKSLMTFYALFHLDPAFMALTKELEMNSDFDYQEVWKRLVMIHDIQVELNTNVDSVQYIKTLAGNDWISVRATNLLTNTQTTQRFDFCIFDIPDPLKVIRQPTSGQRSCLSKFTHYKPVLTTICKIKNKLKYQLVFDNESHYNKGNHTGLSLYKKNQNGDEYSIISVYSYFKNTHVIQKDQVMEIEESVNEQIKFLTKEKVIETIATRINNQFLPHCSADDVKAGVPWQLFNLQGENKMWFTGAVASFDLMQSIICYNVKLLDQYGLGSRQCQQ